MRNKNLQEAIEKCKEDLSHKSTKLDENEKRLHTTESQAKQQAEIILKLEETIRQLKAGLD